MWIAHTVKFYENLPFSAFTKQGEMHMLEFLFLVAWFVVTVVIFMWLKSRATLVSFNGATGFLNAYMGLFIEAGIAAAVVIAIPLWILKSIGWYLVGGVVVIGIVLAIANNNSNIKSNSQDIQKQQTMSIQERQISPEHSEKLVSSNSEKRFCGNCGAPMEIDSQFCGKCGKKA